MNKSGTRPNHDETGSAGGSDHTAAHLEFDDAPDFVSRRSHIPLQRMLALLEQYRQWFPLTAADREQRRNRKCTAEFVLRD